MNIFEVVKKKKIEVVEDLLVKYGSVNDPRPPFTQEFFSISANTKGLIYESVVLYTQDKGLTLHLSRDGQVYYMVEYMTEKDEEHIYLLEKGNLISPNKTYSLTEFYKAIGKDNKTGKKVFNTYIKCGRVKSTKKDGTTRYMFQVDPTSEL